MDIKFLLCLAIIYCVYINEINCDLCSCKTKALRVKPQKKIKCGLQKFKPIGDRCNCCQKIVKPAAHFPEIEWVEPEEHLCNRKIIKQSCDGGLDETFTFNPDPKEYKIKLSKSDDIRLITDALAAYRIRENIKAESSPEYIPFRIPPYSNQRYFKHYHGGKHFNNIDPVSLGLAYEAAKKATIARVEDNLQYGFKKPLLFEVEKTPNIINEQNLYSVNDAVYELQPSLNPRRLEYDDLGYAPAKPNDVIYVQHNHNQLRYPKLLI